MDFQLHMLQELYPPLPKFELAQNQESWLKPGAKYSSSSEGWFVLLKLVYRASTTCSYSPTLIKSFTYLISSSSTSLLSLFMSHLCQIVLLSQQSSCFCVNSQISFNDEMKLQPKLCPKCIMVFWEYTGNSGSGFPSPAGRQLNKLSLTVPPSVTYEADVASGPHNLTVK